MLHNHPSTEWRFTFENETRWDVAKEILDGFGMPVHLALGWYSHDTEPWVESG